MARAVDDQDDPVLALVERSNQRGGRMLSVIDLIRAGTLTRDQTAWLLARIEAGSSWLVGARPGGAGKTTIMSALLALLPPGPAIRLANPGTGWENSAPGDCIVAYELGPGHYDAYVWGRQLKLMTELGCRGCRLVSNLHADTLAEARAQIVETCGANEAGLAAFGLFLPISIPDWDHRRVDEMWAARDGQWTQVPLPLSLTSRQQAMAAFLDECQDRGLQTVTEVRRAWLAWLPRTEPRA